MFFSKKSLAVLAASSIALTAHADESSKNHFYAGIKTGQFLIDVSDFDNARAVGLQFGYQFGKEWSIEFEHTQGDTEFMNVIDTDIESNALYATYRSNSKAYFLTKVGLVKEELSNSNFGIKESDSGLSYGIGGGYNFIKNLGAEVEYTIIEQDMSLLGLNLRLIF